MDDQTLSLLEKALEVTPAQWELRAHLIDAHLQGGSAARAAQLLGAAPQLPDGEAAQLLKARVESETAPSEAIVTLEAILARNKACAQAYLLLARIYKKRGMKDDARRKYGAATIIDPEIHDAELSEWLGISTGGEEVRPRGGRRAGAEGDVR